MFGSVAHIGDDFSTLLSPLQVLILTAWRSTYVGYHLVQYSKDTPSLSPINLEQELVSSYVAFYI